ncbi:unnamed protein product [Prunus brigantina]
MGDIFLLALSPMRASLLKLDLAFFLPLISFVVAMVVFRPTILMPHPLIQRQPSDDDMINHLGPAASPRISNKKLLSRV